MENKLLDEPSNENLEIRDILKIEIYEELDNIQNDKEDALIQNSNTYSILIINWVKLFFIENNKKIIFIWNNLWVKITSITDIYTNDKTFKINDAWVSYNEEWIALQDDNWNYIREVVWDCVKTIDWDYIKVSWDSFYLYDNKFLEIVWIWLIINWNYKYIEDKYWNKIKDIDYINTTNKTFRINNTWISYNEKWIALQDKNWNYIEEVVWDIFY